jgi:hypothetical protein
MRYIILTDHTGAEYQRFALDNDVIERACKLTQELHNRDNPGEPLTISYEDDAPLDVSAED